MEIHWYLLKSLSGNENLAVLQADNNWRHLPISNRKPDHHDINAQTKFGENPLIFIQVIILKRKYALVSGR